MVLLVLAALGAPLSAQTRKLQVILERVDVHMDPDAESRVVAVVPQGSVLTQAAAVKSRSNWFYVYFTSPEGRTRSGYVLDDAVTAITGGPRVVEITAPPEVVEPAPFRLDGEQPPMLRWGIGRDEFIRTEGRPRDRAAAGDTEILSYRREVLGKPCLVEYTFTGRRLSSARYTLTEIYADKNRYILDFAKVKDFLVGRIGPPRDDAVVWQDDTYRADNGAWGRALLLGHLEFHAQWVVGETELLVTLAGGNNRISFGAACQRIRPASSE